MMDSATGRSNLTRIRTPLGSWLSAFIAAILISTHPGCGGESPVDETANEGEDETTEVLRSEKARKTSLSASDVNLDDLVRGNSGFAFDLYGTLRERDGNLFYSPHSISVALAMMYAGARGETARQMEEVLRFQLPADQLHPAFNVLDLALSSRGEGSGGQDAENFRLNIANAIWGQKGYAFLPRFLDTLAENYGAGMRAVDFVENPEASRTAINDWVAKRTEDTIQDLIPQGVIDQLTRLVLTNAIYFNAAWHYPFDENRTTSDSFHLLSGDRVNVPMMHQTEAFNYGMHETHQVQSVEMLYAGEEASLIILLPASGEFGQLEDALSADLVSEISKLMRPIRLRLSVPSFEIKSEFRLGDTLAGMGMPDAFDSESADFSGMAETKELYLSAVVHKAFVKVDERGTEAGAATGGTIGVTSLPPAFTADRPFIFLIRDNATDAILFVGRVLDPR
ncbi:MAG: serpin family protein [Gemmatimonadota bacterium]|nr:serpin family protein [Gemmatimonadota bacterium]